MAFRLEDGAPSVNCTVIMEHPNAHRSTHKKVFLQFGRNEFRDIILKVEVGKSVLKYPLKEAVIHKRFLKEGKATFDIPRPPVKLLLSDAPPSQLLAFLRILCAKLSSQKDVVEPTSHQRFLANKNSSWDKISPLTNKDVENLHKQRAGKVSNQTPLKERNSNADSVQKGKRPREEDIGEKVNKTNVVAKKPLLHSLNAVKLTEEQKSVLNAVLSGKSIFFTGSAGTGKSFLLRRIVGLLPPDSTFVTASTGVAACQIGGTTLHSFAGVGSGQAPLEQCFSKVSSNRLASLNWKKCRHLIVDEISMVDSEFFKKLEAVARMVRGNDRPFGGIQLILCGDFLQLPPVVRGNEKRKFCFQSSTWENCLQLTYELTHVKRQSDLRFVQILQQIRVGECPPKVADRLKATSKNSVSQDGIQATRLCTHSEDVDQVNKIELEKLPGAGKEFKSVDSDPALHQLLDQQTPVSSNLTLKVGSQVMLLKNLDLNAGLVNGARGVVTGFSKEEGLPQVRFLNNHSVTLRFEQWSVKSSSGFILTRKQVPLKLAWAISVHKSQGMTLDCVEMSLSRVFESGQAYVALSRAQSLSSLRILDFDPDCIRAHPAAVAFYKRLRRAQDCQEIIKLG